MEAAFNFTTYSADPFACPDMYQKKIQLFIKSIYPQEMKLSIANDGEVKMVNNELKKQSEKPLGFNRQYKIFR